MIFPPQKCEVCQKPFQLNSEAWRNRLRRDLTTLAICSVDCIAAKRFMLDTTPRIELPIEGHGTDKAYKLGCRCDPCSLHQNKRIRLWKRKRVAEGKFKKSHGTLKEYTCSFCSKVFKRAGSKVKDSQKSSISKRLFCNRTCFSNSLRRNR